ncbi:EIF4B [Mytilus edulis]|uniref:EIF4B n=1 Tax=Mytilus edulis TaxID=6550 RepID=A0A8S3VQJ2_MYTED|nr:EIF4B [Mytilus edulis]
MSSYYMKESTYRHDFGAAKDSNFTRPFPQTYYNTEEMNQRLYQPRPRRARDDSRIPMDQGRGYNDHRQEGPYTDRGGYYDRRYQDDHHYNDGAYTDRPRYDRRDDMNGPSDRGYDRRPDDRDRGAYTDRGGYERRDLNGPDRYGNRTTQKDYGDFSQRTRGQMDKVTKPYRGEIDKEMDSFHNKVRLTFSIHYLTLVCRLSIYEICSESFMVFFNELPFAKQFLLAKSFHSAGLV